MASLQPTNWREDDIVVKTEFFFDGFTRGTYIGTVNAEGEPTGFGNFDQEAYSWERGFAYTGDWEKGIPKGEGWWSYSENRVLAAGIAIGGSVHRAEGRCAFACDASYFEGEFKSGGVVAGSIGVLMLPSDGQGRQVWRLKAKASGSEDSTCGYPSLSSFWEELDANFERLELLGTVIECGPAEPQRKDGGRWPVWSATVKLPDGSVARGSFRSLAEVRRVWALKMLGIPCVHQTNIN